MRAYVLDVACPLTRMNTPEQNVLTINAFSKTKRIALWRTQVALAGVASR